MEPPTEAEVDAVLERLLALGVAEEREGHVGTSRDWNERLQRAGHALNQEVARTGVYPEGPGLSHAVRAAVEEAGLPFEGRERDVAVHVLVMLELVNLSDAKRSQLGYGRLRIPGDE